MSVVIFWFRRDLRLADNPALTAATRAGRVIGCFVLDETHLRALGGAQKWWLHHSLCALKDKLSARGVSLILRRGQADDALQDVVTSTGAAALYFTHLYEPDTRRQEQAVMSRLNCRVEGYHADTLFHPDAIKTKGGTPYKVFTPFWRACKEEGLPQHAVAAPDLTGADSECASDNLDDWALLPTAPDWASRFADRWTPGEDGAHEKLDRFAAQALSDYGDDRDRPDRYGTSRLSPHLHWGEISPVQIAARFDDRRKSGVDPYLTEIGWREFGRHLLWHQPNFERENFQPKFNQFAWQSNNDALVAWQRGRTGYPIVDAGMRELWTSGWMHNRVRMIVASFLTKHLLIHWREGEAWFWDTLVDADLASNAMGWQWVAGTGADAAPYFRIFNPISQGEKFDPQGDYIRRWVPELADLPTRHLYAPWKAPQDTFQRACIKLGDTYPMPVIEHDKARQRALDAYQSMKEHA